MSARHGRPSLTACVNAIFQRGSCASTSRRCQFSDAYELPSTIFEGRQHFLPLARLYVRLEGVAVLFRGKLPRLRMDLCVT